MSGDWKFGIVAGWAALVCVWLLLGIIEARVNRLERRLDGKP